MPIQQYSSIHSDSIMGTLDFLREQIAIKDDKLSNADSIINHLQNQIYELHVFHTLSLGSQLMLQGKAE